jgi:hypothetical protein
MLPDFRVRQRDYLLEITRALTEELDLDRVLDRIARISAEILGGRACLIVLRHEGGWKASASYGINPAFLERDLSKPWGFRPAQSSLFRE